MSPEKEPFQKEISSFDHQFSGDMIPSWELTYPLQAAFDDDFPSPQAGYVGSL